MTKTQHLESGVMDDLQLPPAERILKIRSPRWIGYTRAKQILGKLNDLFTYPKTHRMPNLLLVGDTNNGKTMIANRFKRLHPADDDPGGAGVWVPVLSVQAPPVPDENRFYNLILDRLFAPYRAQSRVDQKQHQVMTLLKRVDLKMLIIDEIQHILAGTSLKQRHFLNTIKFLGNELQIPIVGVGTKEAFNALQSDPQLANRFEPAILPKWEPNEEYLKLLASFERMLPLQKPSQLTKEDLAMKILALSEGTIGEISSLLTAAAVEAVNSGTERITLSTFQKISWTPPSNRKWRSSQFA